ncbi:MAG: hypothetical protein AAGH76_15060 [Pseudomonadota bacterium]
MGFGPRYLAAFRYTTYGDHAHFTCPSCAAELRFITDESNTSVTAVFGAVALFLIMMVAMLHEHIGSTVLGVLFVLAILAPVLLVNSLFASHLPIGLKDAGSS